MRGPAPDPDPDSFARIFSPPISHRGLWSPAGAPENSLAAFEAACEAGYGIELDVQLSADGEAMVFHDDHLARMAGAAARLSERTAHELSALRLKSSRETIPTLAQVLDQVCGRTLILIEIKSRPGEEGPLDQRVLDVIDAYHGPLAVIGFNAKSHAWWRARKPGVLRGWNTTLSEQQSASGGQAADNAAHQALKALDLAAPHFLAPSLAMLATRPVTSLREQGWPLVAWTCRTSDQWRGSHTLCDNLIFEGFAP